MADDMTRYIVWADGYPPEGCFAPHIQAAAITYWGSKPADDPDKIYAVRADGGRVYAFSVICKMVAESVTV